MSALLLFGLTTLRTDTFRTNDSSEEERNNGSLTEGQFLGIYFLPVNLLGVNCHPASSLPPVTLLLRTNGVTQSIHQNLRG